MTTLQKAADDLNGLIANSDVMVSYKDAKQLTQQKKTLDNLIVAHTTIIKEYMNDATILLSMSGAEIVTYKYDRDGETLDQDMVKELFPEVWRACQKVRIGARKFVLK